MRNPGFVDKMIASDDRLASALAHRRDDRSVEGSYRAGYEAGRRKFAGTYTPPTPATSTFAYHALAKPMDIVAALRRGAGQLEDERRALDARAGPARRSVKEIKREMRGLEELSAFIDGKPPTLSKHETSVVHRLIVSGLTETTHNLRDLPTAVEEWKRIKDNVQVFVVDHDWAAALSNSNVGEGEVRAPYDLTCFEMTVNGRRCCYIQPTPALSDYGASVFVETSAGWYLFGRTERDEKACTVGRFLIDQVRAVCVSLDAEVATAETVRAPHNTNAARADPGQLPPFDYRIVQLSRKPRASPVAASSAEPIRHKRVHFRRGHWRHFSTYKTWIKWMLVGDPDLGWVDKHYRG